MNDITGGFAYIDVRTDINCVGLKVNPESCLLPITMISFGILFFVSLHFVMLVKAMQGRALYRNEAQDFSVGEKSISLLTSRDAIIINSGRSDRLHFPLCPWTKLPFIQHCGLSRPGGTLSMWIACYWKKNQNQSSTLMQPFIITVLR